MSVEPSPEVQSASQLLRRGRFSEAVTALQHISTVSSRRKNDPFANVLLADALQRIGRDADAETIARAGLERSEQRRDIAARFHLVLANVLRERGDLPRAISHLQIAATQSVGDPESLCWAHLRLLTTVAELSGSHTAAARIDEVRRVLSRYGDARPFAALHLWRVETDTMRGALESARYHLNIARSLLVKVDDVWLQGYLAINSSVLNYYSADVPEARRWAELAIVFARESGHRITRRAAYANLGYYEFASGHLTQAEEYFDVALQCCEHGSANEIAILDNIAEVRLERGDFDGCRSILSQLEKLTTQDHDSKKRQYKEWAAQTRIRLFLREGRSTEAKAEANNLHRNALPSLDDLPHVRLSAESRLLAAEALLSH